MLSNKKQIITLFFLFISLPFFEFGLDYFFGDQDGKIVRFGISKIINIFQFLIVIIITIILYKIKTFYCIIFILISSFIIDFKIINRILYDDQEYIHRHPHPYVGFTGEPNKGESPHKHNQFGFLGPELNHTQKYSIDKF